MWLCLSAHASPILVRRAGRGRGARLSREGCWDEELLRAVRAAASGERYIGQKLAHFLLDARRNAGPREFAVEILTPAERDILRLVTEGKSNFEVAAAIGLSPRTVETYRGRLMRNVGIENLLPWSATRSGTGLIPLE